MLAEIADIAEIIASLGVILSLLFVGFQMREGNRAARLNAIQSIWEFEMELAGKMLDHAGPWNKAVRGQPIEDEVQLRQAIIMFNMLMSESENRYYQFKEGYLRESEWLARRSSLELLLKLPIYTNWRQSISARNHSAEFMTLVENLAGENAN